MNVPDTPRNRTLGEILGLIFTVCAAHEDATPEQRRDLQERLRPELNAFKRHKNPARVHDRLREIMPPGWAPTGQWAEGIADPRGVIARELLRRGVADAGPFG